jgi:hypothetical protein
MRRALRSRHGHQARHQDRYVSRRPGSDAILVSGGVDVSGDTLNIVCQLVRRGVYIITVIGA